MDLLSELRGTLVHYGLWAKKRLGQHFLIDARALQSILSAAELHPGETVVEVGPGTGILTQALLKQGVRVIAVERDPDMVRILRDRFGSLKEFRVIQSDILRVRPDTFGDAPYKMVANIPYYITSPILKLFLRAPHPPALMVLLTQKEVAEKVCGLSGRSLITLETHVFGNPEIVARVPAQSFYPPPKVDSAVLRVTPFANPLVSAKRQRDFFRLAQFAFAGKRKQIANSLGAGLHQPSSEIAERLRAAGLSSTVRPEEWTVQEWIRLDAALNGDE